MTAVALEPPVVGTRAAIRDALPLLAGVGLLMAGNGLTSTLLGIRAGLEGFSPGIVGVVLAGYYMGFVAGSLAAPATIARVGHIRVFAGLASLGSGAVLIHVVRPEPMTWFLLRAVSGMCISALYVVCETWLNGASTNRTRGTLLGTYMVVVSGSLLFGQLLFSLIDPGGFGSFVLASVLLSLAVVPVSLVRLSAPPMLEAVPLSLRALTQVAPLATVGAAVSGFTGSAMLGAGVIYAAEAGFGQGETGALVGAALAGGVLLQVPLGRWSDNVDRRFVIATAAVVAALFALAAALLGSDHPSGIIALSVVAGGTTFPLYALSNAHLNDYLDQALVVAGGAQMVLVNGAGAIAGPMVGATVISRIGPGALFITIALGYGAIGAYALYRMTRRAAPPDEERATFAPAAVGVGPIPVALDLDVEELYPRTEGTFELDGGAISYQEQGTGRPVVLVCSPGEPGCWDDVLPALAADGFRAIAPNPRPGAEAADEHIEDLLGVLRALGAPSASFVGRGEMTEVVARLAAEHPDRVEAVTLLAPNGGELPSPLPPEGTVPDPTEHEARSPAVLVLDPARAAEPEELADDIAEFLRRLPRPEEEGQRP